VFFKTKGYLKFMKFKKIYDDFKIV
jgi:hypothetical protein